MAKTSKVVDLSIRSLEGHRRVAVGVEHGEYSARSPEGKRSSEPARSPRPRTGRREKKDSRYRKRSLLVFDAKSGVPWRERARSRTHVGTKREYEVPVKSSAGGTRLDVKELLIHRCRSENLDRRYGDLYPGTSCSILMPCLALHWKHRCRKNIGSRNILGASIIFACLMCRLRQQKLLKYLDTWGIIFVRCRSRWQKIIRCILIVA